MPGSVDAAITTVRDDLIALLRRNASVRLEIIALDSELSLRAVSADVVLWLAPGDSPSPGPSFAEGQRAGAAEQRHGAGRDHRLGLRGDEHRPGGDVRDLCRRDRKSVV